MNDDQLVELIARQVRARLMAGGQGPGFTRAGGVPQAASTPAVSRSEVHAAVQSAVVGALTGFAPTPAGQMTGPACDDECLTCGMSEMPDPKGLSSRGTTGDPGDLARYIDHTLLKPEATREELRQLADEAREHKFATVCVNSSNVRLMAQFLRGSSVPVCAVVGFPLGAMLPKSKAYETKEAIRCGASEIDMVLNIGALKSRDLALVFEDIVAVVEAAAPVPVKVIIETSKLDDEEKVIACALSKAAKAAFVKTSTGFAGGGATPADIALMRRVVGPYMGVKASGGVRSREDAIQLIGAGATRLGASSSVAIVTGKKSNSAY